MITLAIELSTNSGSLALLDNNQVQLERTWSEDRLHRQQVFAEIELGLSDGGVDLSRVDLFAVGVGPGSFSGLRMAISAVCAMAMPDSKPVYAVASVENLAVVKGPILVLNPHLYPEAELKALAAYKGGPIIFVGGETARFPKTDPDVRFEDVYPPNQLSCRVYGAKVKVASRIRSDGEETIPPNPMAVPDDANWRKPLNSRKVSNGFLDACAQVISDCASPIKVCKGGMDIKVFAVEGAPGVLRFLVGNDAYHSISSEIDVGQPIADARVATRFPSMPYGWSGPQIWEGSRFVIKVPPRGMTIVDITLKR